MPGKANQNVHAVKTRRISSPTLHPAWVAFIRHCQGLGFGEITKLKIQDGVPVLAEETTRKVKFN